MSHVSGPVGNVIHACLYSVNPGWFSRSGRLDDLVGSALRAESYEVIDSVVTPFRGDLPAYTGMKCISESHIGYHTYAEHDSIDVTLNTCRSADAGWLTVAYIVAAVMPEKVRVVSSSVPLRGEIAAAHSSDIKYFHGRPEDFIHAFRDAIEVCGGRIDGLLDGSSVERHLIS